MIGIKCSNSIPPVANSSTVLSLASYMVDDLITFTCKDGYLHLPDGAKNSTVRCDFEGWEATTGCQKGETRGERTVC